MKKWFGSIAAAAFLMASCGGGAGDEGSHSHSHDDSHSHDMTGTDVSWGEPAEASAADRTIEVSALDSYTFDPSTVRSTAGETVRFVVTNEGDMLHEFFIGIEEEQLAHATEMGGDMGHHDSPLVVEVLPGQTRELTWTFTGSGTLQYACHIDDHFSRGMIGAIEVSQ